MTRESAAVYSLAWMRDNLLMKNVQGGLEKVREKLDEQWTQDRAMQFFLDAVNKAGEKSPEAVKEWGPLDKITWAVKEAYMSGYLNGLDTFHESCRMAIEREENR